MKKSKLILLAAIALIIALFFILGWDQYFNIDFIKQNKASFEQQLQQHPWQTGGIFFGIYLLVTSLSLPGAAIMTLVAGALFGLGWGTLIVSFASTLGATGAFLLSRWLFRTPISRRFDQQLRVINRGVDKEGAFYLFGLRLVPLFPFFMINLLMGITSIGVWRYFWVSQLGMLPGTLVYVYAGTQLGQIDSLAGIISPGMLAAFVLLGLFPLVAKKGLASLKARRLYSHFTKPANYDRNIIVIGAGSGGLVASLIGAAVKAKVSLIEKHQMGGDCLNTGCVPSKALIRSAKFAASQKKAANLGFTRAEAEVDFAKVMERIQGVIKQIEPHDSVERFTSLGVDVIQGSANILSPWEVEVNGQRLTTKNIIIATGARPFVPPIDGLDQVSYLTSDNLWELRTLPRRLVVLGGGPIGSELTQAFARLGSQVTQVELLDRLMPREDSEVSDYVKETFIKEGVDVRTGHKAERVEVRDGEKFLICEADGQSCEFAFDELLIAVGRAANTSGFGLEKLGVQLRPNHTIEVDDYLRTNIPNILACGDVTGPYQFTHVASHQAWYTTVNSLFGRFKKFKVDYSVIPWATFVDPEVARVGLNEQEAQEQGIPYEVTRYDLDDLDRAIADGETSGWVKILTRPGKDKILGATIVGSHAGELITEYVSAMKHGLGLNKILGTIHIYPTMSEANKFVAGQWKRNHAPEWLLTWVEKYHRKQRQGKAPKKAPSTQPATQPTTQPAAASKPEPDAAPDSVINNESN